MSQQTIWLYNFIGWVLFLLSAAFFTWNSVLAGDLIGMIASLLFLVACLVFLVPVWRMRPSKN